MINGGNPLTKMLGNIVKRNEDLEKRVARLETLEFTSYTGGGGWHEIETLTKADSTELTFSFQNIPQIYLHLALIVSVQAINETAYGIIQLLMRINNDSSNLYWYIVDQLNITGPPYVCNRSCWAAFPTKVSFWLVCQVPAAGDGESNDPNCFNAAHIWVPDYRNQYKKRSGVWDNYTNEAKSGEAVRRLWREQGGGTYHDTTAVSRLDFWLSSNDPFAKNSKISLYGIQGTFEEYV